MFWFLGADACGILASQPGIEPVPPALEGEVLTTGPLGKAPDLAFLDGYSIWYWQLTFKIGAIIFLNLHTGENKGI